MPRINLVPLEEQQRELRRQLYIIPVAGALVLAGVLGGTYYYYNNQVSNAETQLQDIKNSNASLQKQVNELKKYEEVKNKKQAQLNIVTGLYGQRVRWSRTLGDIAFVIPDDVWLISIKARVPGVETAGAASTSSSGSANIRDIEIEGYTKGMPSVAVLLMRLGLIPSMTEVTLVSAEKEDMASQIVTHFKISATLKQTGEIQGPSVAPVTGEDGPSSVTPTTGTSTTPTTGSTTPTGTTPGTTGTTR
ncbi:MAG: PilN domain-containing protein [Thermoleophilia bacterium]|nr:PilN domain-containing protein [Thermoleophilia bacterium]